MRRFPFAIPAAIFVAAACSGRGAGDGPGPAGRNTVARPLEVYQGLGMLAGPADFPAVARVATLAGPADSTYLIISMSMPNSAVRFQRDDTSFHAEYRVVAAILRDTVQIHQFERRETVRVSTFAETMRTEESVVFQDVIALAPGAYTLRLQVADMNSSRGFRGIDTVAVPAYPRDGVLGTPLLVYQATGRSSVRDRPDIIINPRNTIAYGGDDAGLYLELYGSALPQPVVLRIVDDNGAALWTGEAKFEYGTEELRHELVDVPASTLGLGRLWLEALTAPDAKPERLPLLITISEQWMVANFDEVLRFIEYIAVPVEVDSLRKATGLERRDRWERFWARRDPLPATPINEFREQFFERVRIATEDFRETGRAGWETNRGEVFIVLGAPDMAIDRFVGRDVGAQANMIEWLYDALPGGRLVLQFIDRSGFGRFELTQASEAAFRSTVNRMRPRS